MYDYPDGTAIALYAGLAIFWFIFAIAAYVLTSVFMIVNGHLELPVGGQQDCPLVARRTARSWPTDLPTGVWWRRPWSGSSVSSSG